MRILVVDDTRLIREMVSAIIRHEGYTPITTSRASEALAGNKIEHKYSETADYVTASMDISASAKGASNAEDLLHQADSAVYEAKESGRNRFVCYSPVQTESQAE